MSGFGFDSGFSSRVWVGFQIAGFLPRVLDFWVPHSITIHRVHYGHLLKELSDYFFFLPEPLIRERYIVFLLQSYCHVLTMTLEMLDVDWQKHFGELSFNKMVIAFYHHVPRAILQSVIVHMGK